MAIKTLILAGNPREGGRYAKRAGLARWTYRVVHAGGQIKGLPWSGCEVHILPSFSESRSRHSILSTLKHKRVSYFYVDPADLPTLESLAEAAQTEQLGELDDKTLEAAHAENEKFDHVGFARAHLMAEIDGMTDEQVAERIRRATPDEETALVQAVAAKPKTPKPRKPRAPAAPAQNFFGD